MDPCSACQDTQSIGISRRSRPNDLARKDRKRDWALGGWIALVILEKKSCFEMTIRCVWLTLKTAGSFMSFQMPSTPLAE